MADLKRRLFGYSSASVRLLLTERDAALERASKNASAAEQRAESLSSELSETKGRLAGLEEQLDTAEKLCVTLTADLERSVAQRESMEAEVLPLRSELEKVRTELRGAKEAILGRDGQLRAAQATASAEQARMTELEALVEGYRELIEGRSDAEVSSVGPNDAQEAPAGPSTASELAAVIEVTEQAVATIMESARVRADEELRAIDGERERIRRDVETMTAWRDRAAAMIASLQAALHEIQSQGAEIGRRVIEALRPVSTAVTALNSQLASLDDLARAPVDVSTEAEAAAAPSEADDVMELPEEHPAGRDTSDW
jgi:chromosome segregation ATPase